MIQPTPSEQISSGFAAAPAREDRNLAFRAAGYRPERDAEADRMRTIAERLTANQRMQLGYHDSARAAAEALARKDDDR